MREALRKMVTGEKIIIYAILSVLSVGTVLLAKAMYDGYQQEIGYNERIEEEKRAGIKLDEKSNIISGKIDDIATAVKEKIEIRVSGQSAANIEAVREAAYIQGKLEGKSEGYKKGFDDAETIPNTCINDPAFLSDRMRDDARSRYKAIFGSPSLAGQAPSSSGLSGSTSGAIGYVQP